VFGPHLRLRPLHYGKRPTRAAPRLGDECTRHGRNRSLATQNARSASTRRASLCHRDTVTSRISHTTIDASNAWAQSIWWSQVLGFAEDPNDPNLPEHEECLILSPDGTTRLLFINVPDRKIVKNRVHLDLRPADTSRDEEVERVLGLGATLVADRRLPDGRGWVVLADREGNEFCILRSQAEVAPRPDR
jgi:hypothetical protein